MCLIYLIKRVMIHGNKTVKTVLRNVLGQIKPVIIPGHVAGSERRLAVMTSHDNRPSPPSGTFSIPDN